MEDGQTPAPPPPQVRGWAGTPATPDKACLTMEDVQAPPPPQVRKSDGENKICLH